MLSLLQFSIRHEECLSNISSVLVYLSNSRSCIIKINLKHASAHVCVSFIPNGLDVHLKLTSIKIALGVLCCLAVLRDSQHSCFQCWKEDYFYHFWWHVYNKKDKCFEEKSVMDIFTSLINIHLNSILALGTDSCLFCFAYGKRNITGSMETTG